MVDSDCDFDSFLFHTHPIIPFTQLEPGNNELVGN